MTTSALSDPLTHYKRILKSWHEPKGEVLYRWLQNVFAIDAKVREAAEAGRKFACLHLGVDVPELLFYREATSAEKAYAPADMLFTGARRNGHADRSTHTIGVRVEDDCRPKLACEVAAHEVRHLTQVATNDSAQVKAQENDALAYGRWAAGAIFFGRRIANVHTHPGHPWNYITLKDKANQWDVVLNTSSRSEVFVNFGYGDTPLWNRYDELED